MFVIRMLFVGPPIFGFSPIFRRKDQSMLILLLLIPEPPRLAKTRMEMKPKIL
jgi:hypothetical protein